MCFPIFVWNFTVKTRLHNYGVFHNFCLKVYTVQYRLCDMPCCANVSLFLSEVLMGFATLAQQRNMSHSANGLHICRFIVKNRLCYLDAAAKQVVLRKGFPIFICTFIVKNWPCYLGTAAKPVVRHNALQLF